MFIEFFKSLFRHKQEQINLLPITPSNDTQIPDSSGEFKWTVFASIHPSKTLTDMFRVTYNSELGSQYVHTCMVIFESASEYKLVAPWISTAIVIQKSNISDFKAQIVDKSMFLKT